VTSAVVTVGNFDGVHLGHQYLLRQVVDRARALGLRSYAITFDPHPSMVLHPERNLEQLTDADEKVRLLRELGIDDVWVCPFNRDLSRLGADEFMQVVAQRQPIAELWIGPDFAMGHDRKGTVSVLAMLGGEQGWALHMVPPFRLDGHVVSSTAVRQALSTGDVKEAEKLLGRTVLTDASLRSGGAPR
jgi:riboflavin kinase/FMN adenylyltransferase